MYQTIIARGDRLSRDPGNDDKPTVKLADESERSVYGNVDHRRED